MLGGALRVMVTSVAHRGGGAFDLGVGAAALDMSGKAIPPSTRRSDRVWAAAHYVRSRQVKRLLDRRQLGLDVLAGVSAPRAVVRFASRDAASGEAAHRVQPAPGLLM